MIVFTSEKLYGNQIQNLRVAPCSVLYKKFFDTLQAHFYRQSFAPTPLFCSIPSCTKKGRSQGQGNGTYYNLMHAFPCLSMLLIMYHSHPYFIISCQRCALRLYRACCSPFLSDPLSASPVTPSPSHPTSHCHHATCIRTTSYHPT